MSESRNGRGALLTGGLAAILASTCCLGPLVLVTLGIGGAWVSNLSKLEPLRPVFIVATLGLLAWAWHKLYRTPEVCEPGALCADPKVRHRQRLIFWVVAVVLTLLLTFPWYASLFY